MQITETKPCSPARRNLHSCYLCVSGKTVRHSQPMLRSHKFIEFLQGQCRTRNCGLPLGGSASGRCKSSIHMLHVSRNTLGFQVAAGLQWSAHERVQSLGTQENRNLHRINALPVVATMVRFIKYWIRRMTDPAEANSARLEEHLGKVHSRSRSPALASAFPVANSPRSAKIASSGASIAQNSPA